MSAPFGNDFWKLRFNHGRKMEYETLEDLILKIEDYFLTESERTWEEEDWVGRDAYKVTRHHPVPFTKKGLCLHLGISIDTLQNYKERGQDFLDVITRAEEICYTQKFEGAALGFFNQRLISNELGQTSKVDLSTDKPLVIEISGKKIKL